MVVSPKENFGKACVALACASHAFDESGLAVSERTRKTAPTMAAISRTAATTMIARVLVLVFVPIFAASRPLPSVALLGEPDPHFRDCFMPS
jgi:hypothetical protein